MPVVEFGLALGEPVPPIECDDPDLDGVVFVLDPAHADSVKPAAIRATGSRTVRFIAKLHGWAAEDQGGHGSCGAVSDRSVRYSRFTSD